MNLDKCQSILGEEVYLTKEDLIEMKLYNINQWVVDCSSYDVRDDKEDIGLFMSILYNTTNLLEDVEYDAKYRLPRCLVSSDRKYDVDYSKGRFVRPVFTIHFIGSWTLFPEEVYYVIPK